MNNIYGQKIIFAVILMLLIIMTGAIFSFSRISGIAADSSQQSEIPDKINKAESPVPTIKATSDNSIPDHQKTYLFEGPVENIFFHPLIAYPSRAFDGDSQSNGFDDWFVTVDEFKKVIRSVYEKGYVLVDISSLYEEQTINGTTELVRKPLYVPEEKKPLILSVDDLNYYKYMIGNGTIAKIIVDETGKPAALSEDGQNNKVISYDNEVIPILDKFIKDHPDFSLNGAKGIIALTGFEGILGYRTAEAYKNHGAEREAVKPVITALKRDGWSFASHSYFHKHINAIDLSLLKKDADLWEKEVGSLTGPANVYIFPFGERTKNTDLKFLYLKSKGFRIFIGVGPYAYEKFIDGTVLTLRRHVDGVAFRHQRLLNLNLYDADKVIDLSVRPKR